MSRRQRTPLVLSAAAAATLLLAGCSSAGSAPAEQPAASPVVAVDLLAEHGLDGLTGQELVEQLDASPDARPLAIGASVRPDEVLVSDGTTEVAVALPGDQQYVSIAPFVTRTHECYFHDLGSCQGELAKEPVEVTITTDDGEILVEEATTTYANGFVGFWLPRDITGTIEVTQGELSGSVPFATTEESPTCVTTLQLTEGGVPATA